MLTDDQIDEIGTNFPGGYLELRAFARAILEASETQLKEEQNETN